MAIKELSPEEIAELQPGEEICVDGIWRAVVLAPETCHFGGQDYPSVRVRGVFCQTEKVIQPHWIAERYSLDHKCAKLCGKPQ